MRFGRRGKGKSREPIWARRSEKKSGMNIPDEGSAAPAMDIVSAEGEAATQEILTHLGRFSREWSSPESALWSDACMNQLILCIEIAIEEGWSDLTTVLSDTGRVLQTYENAERPAGAILFLKKAYDVMCRLVGDIVIEKSPLETMEEWARVFEEGITAIAADRLELFEDDEGDEMSAEEMLNESVEQELPMEGISESGVARETTLMEDRDALPVLDELPPLESLVTIYTEPEKAEDAVEDVVEPPSEIEEPTEVDAQEEASMGTESQNDRVEEPESNVEEFHTIESFVTSEPEPDRVYIPEESACIENAEALENILEETNGGDEEETNSTLDFASFAMPRVETSENEEPSLEEASDESIIEEAEADTTEGTENFAVCDAIGSTSSVARGILLDALKTPSASTDDHEAVEKTEQRVGVTEPVENPDDIDEPVTESAEEESTDTEEEELEVYDPPRIVVDIIDRICDVLGQFEKAPDTECTEGLDIVLGGLKALKHEAEVMKNATAESCCGTMMEACRAVRSADGKASERFLEIGFSFCGIFIECLSEPESENVTHWREECETWLKDAEAIAKEAEDTSNVVLAFPQKMSTESENTPRDNKVAESDSPPEAIASTQEDESDAEKSIATEEIAAIDHAERSQSLLQSAQDAALQGRGEDAKTFALRAAAEIAKDGVVKAESSLRACELKLKEGIATTEEARTGVRSCEERVNESTARVTESQESYSEAKEATATVVKTLEDLEHEVADLNRHIQELQLKRDEEVERISQTVTELESVRATDQQASNELDELRRLEDDGRVRLEESRQRVKDKSRVVQTIESEMERARETLTKEKVSYSDITQAIQQISGTGILGPEEGENLLF